MEKGEGPATVLAMGTAVPSNVFYQKDYPDFYFNITNSDHHTELKLKFQRMCEKSRITKRHLFLNEELLRSNPSICAYWDRSLDVRQDMVVVEVPKLAKVAATNAIKEWGQPKTHITHLIFCTTAGVDMPGADWALLKLLGLQSSVQRIMLYQQGCHGGGIVLRMAKDLAENNRNARILVVCSEITAVTFRGPSDMHLDSLVGQALFGDGAAALIVGCGPFAPIEHAWFEVHHVASTVLPDSEGAIDGHLREVGLTFHLLKDVPSIIGKNIASIVKEMLSHAFINNNNNSCNDDCINKSTLVEAFSWDKTTNYNTTINNADSIKENTLVTTQPLISSLAPSYNNMFWIVHPGGPAILDHIEDKLGLDKFKLHASRHILDQYGNMSSACVFFIMDHMRQSSFTNHFATSGEGHEWGFLLAFGPGLTCESILLRSLALPNSLYTQITKHNHAITTISK